MKKILYLFSAFMITACVGQTRNTNNSSDTIPAASEVVEDTVTEEIEEVKPEKKQSQAEFIKEWEDQGVTAFSFDKNGYLVYQVADADLNADPDWVAKLYYDLAANVEGIMGCRVINYAEKEMGRYEK